MGDCCGSGAQGESVSSKAFLLSLYTQHSGPGHGYSVAILTGQRMCCDGLVPMPQQLLNIKLSTLPPRSGHQCGRLLREPTSWRVETFHWI